MNAKQQAVIRQRLGRRGEEIAVRFLKSQGYSIEGTNIRFPVGEIDVLAWEGNVLCFVEVRSASSSDWGGPLASITHPKRRRLIRAAQWYLQRRRPLPDQMRFDVVAIQWDVHAEPALELIKGAFECS